jgi:hypothetical protein
MVESSNLHESPKFQILQGYNIREKLMFPAINRWFDAMETYLGDFDRCIFSPSCGSIQWDFQDI